MKILLIISAIMLCGCDNKKSEVESRPSTPATFEVRVAPIGGSCRYYEDATGVVIYTTHGIQRYSTDTNHLGD